MQVTTGWRVSYRWRLSEHCKDLRTHLVLTTNPGDVHHRTANLDMTGSLDAYLEKVTENSAMSSENDEVNVKHEYDQQCKQRT
jgi:hypothetical protein